MLRCGREEAQRESFRNASKSYAHGVNLTLVNSHHFEI